ncbi:VOC family protein [Granulicoccus phenolivorans]|uniref:VOC family protein n=1 Tax=Granulicoccus phenolivorans TaxID=266854 RepID=UPI0004195956|nr:VOC family protein [Granulicoccus phenolivorans]
MSLANLMMQARDPHTLGRFWTEALGLTVLADEPAWFRGRLSLGAGAFLDVCIEPVATPPALDQRLHLDLLGGPRQAEIVERLIGLGARRLDIGQHDVPWVVLADPDGHPFCVMEERAAYRSTGPIAALVLECGEPHREAAGYAALSGWVPAEGVAPATLRHPAGVGPLLEFTPQRRPKDRQNRTHLDIRPDPGGPDQAALVALARDLGAAPVTADWAYGHPWVVLQDLSGNEFCVLADGE